MDEDLRRLFLAKGLPVDIVDGIQESDGSLRSIDDLATGAVSEADARSWADELQIAGRVTKSRFIQSWLEARTILNLPWDEGTSAAPPDEHQQSAAPSAAHRPARDTSPTKPFPGSSSGACVDEPASVRQIFAPGPRRRSMEAEEGRWASSSAATEGARDSDVQAYSECGSGQKPMTERDVKLKRLLAQWTSTYDEMAGTKAHHDPDDIACGRDGGADAGGGAEEAEHWPAPLRPRPFPQPATPVSTTPVPRPPAVLPMPVPSTPMQAQSMPVPAPTVAMPAVKKGVEQMETAFKGVQDRPMSMPQRRSRPRRGGGGPSSVSQPAEQKVPVPYMVMAREEPPEPRQAEAERALATDDRMSTEVTVPTIDVLHSTAKEPFDEPGGLSGPLQRTLRKHGLTVVEVGALARSMAPRTCRDFALGLTDEDQVRRAAKVANIASKVSQERFVEAWKECVASIAPVASPPAAGGQRRGPPAAAVPSLPAPDNWLRALVTSGDFEACTSFLMENGKVERKEDLVPLIRGMLGHIAERQRQKGGSKEDRTGPEDGTAQAEWRWRWTVRALLAPRFALALQRQTLEAYKADHFQAACRKLDREWGNRSEFPKLEQRHREVEELCLRLVLVHVLPRFGFSPDSSGVVEMKAAIKQHMKTSAPVRQLHSEISTAIMKLFKNL